MRLGSYYPMKRDPFESAIDEILASADGDARRALRAVLAELDLLMAVDGYPSIADLRAAGAQRI